MWILRFQNITSKQYNLSQRYCHKRGFFPRQISPIIFFKGFLEHVLERKSWREIGKKLGVSHIQLHNFFTKYKDDPEIFQIFHAFANDRIIVFIGNTREFTQSELENSERFLDLTGQELHAIFAHINQ